MPINDDLVEKSLGLSKSNKKVGAGELKKRKRFERLKKL